MQTKQQWRQWGVKSIYLKVMKYVVRDCFQRTTASMCTLARRLRGCGISALFLELCVCRTHYIAKTFQIETTNWHCSHITFFILPKFLILLIVFWKTNMIIYRTLEALVRFYFCSCLCCFPSCIEVVKSMAWPWFGSCTMTGWLNWISELW